MNAITWSDALALDMPVMDQTHQEFVGLLARVQNAPDTLLPEAWRDLLLHTEAHFGQEDAWMLATGFANNNCHTVQHEVVLQVMREALQRARDTGPALLRRMAQELADWFPVHAQTMDAALAFHLRGAGMDLHTGQLPQALRLPIELVRGCGDHACGSAEVAAKELLA